MEEFLGGLMVGTAVGAIAILVALFSLGATPDDMQKKLCAEAEWNLPSCVARLERAVDEAKGIRK